MRCRYRLPDVRRVLLLAVAAVVLAGAGDAAAAPLIPRELSSLARSPHALVRVDNSRSANAISAAGGRSCRAASGSGDCRAGRHSGSCPGWRSPARSSTSRRSSRAGGAITETPATRSPSSGGSDDRRRPRRASRAGAAADGRGLRRRPHAPRVRVAARHARARRPAPDRQHGVPRDRRHVGRGGAGERRRLVGVYPRALLGIWDARPRGLLSSSAVIQGIEARSLSARA